MRKLYRRRIIGGKHTAIEHITSAVPPHLQGEARKAAEDLIRDGLIIPKPTSYGLQISLNPRMLAVIEEIIEDFE